MEAQEIYLSRFIGDNVTIVIPVYQRNYNWRKNNCERLFHDIEKIITTGKPHFFGTLVYQSQEKNYFAEYVIIDGQQRITSTILLARALYNLIEDENSKNTIKNIFLRHSTGAMCNQFKLKPTEFDRDVFTKLMDENFSENNFTELEKLSKIYINYKFFVEKISKSEHNVQEIYHAISKLKVVRILLTDENPQEIFESLNSTGLDLSNSDLIRNYLLMSLNYSTQENLYKNYWLKIELLLQSTDAVETFITQYLITKRRSTSVQRDKNSSKLSKTNLYNSFKEYFEERYNGGNRDDDVENFLKDAYRYAQFYSKCTFSDGTVFDELSELEKKFYELTFLLDAVNAPIILMYLYDRYDKGNFDEETFINFVDALISLSFRAKVCKLGVIAAQFAGNVIARLDKKNYLNEKIFWQTLTFGKGTYNFPNDEDFKQALTTADLYGNMKESGCKYFFYSLEKNFSTNVLPPYDDVVIDHVIPQRLNQDWKKYLQDKKDLQAHENWRGTLGNLILTRSYEKDVGAEFSKKKDKAAKSTFQFTKDLEKYSEWTSRQIQARAKKLANAAVKIWILPEEYQGETVSIETIFNLDSDFGFFTGKKPDIISIFNVEKKVATWREFLTEFVMQFYTLEPDNFKLAAQIIDESRQRKLFSTKASDLLTAFKINENFFVETTSDTVQKLKLMKAIAENFDEISGTNFKDDIWFTLQNKS